MNDAEINPDGKARASDEEEGALFLAILQVLWLLLIKGEHCFASQTSSSILIRAFIFPRSGSHGTHA